MLRNDYRRALIMLRAIERDYAGHARLERRTLIGSLCFTASAPGAARLWVALVGRRGSDYYAAPLGEMRRDSRGQYGLIASFDPRDIAGRELEAYQLATIADGANGSCRLALVGNVNGSVEMDWGRVRETVCALWSEPSAPESASAPDAAQEETLTDSRDETPALDSAPGAEAMDASPAGETPLTWDASGGSSDNSAQADGTSSEAPLTWDASGNGSAQADGTSSEAPLTWDASGEAAGYAQTDESSCDNGSALMQDASWDSTQTGETVFPDTLGQATALDVPQAQDATLDASQPWPAAFEAVRSLFQTREAMDDPPVAGYVFVRETLPEGSGYPYVAIGVRVEDGVPARLVYAFPAAYTPAPPAGFEDCVWVGGAKQGWWLRAGAH